MAREMLCNLNSSNGAVWAWHDRCFAIWQAGIPAYSKHQTIKTMKLLSIDTNAKTKKGQAKGYMTGILYLAPADMSGRNFCPHASAGCKAACLFSAGRGAFDSVKTARLKKSHYFLRDRESFLKDLRSDIVALIKKSKKAGMNPCVRLNGTSDIPWHKFGIMDEFQDVPFYDYTPNHSRMIEYLDGKLPANYSLTFSRKENNQSECDDVLNRGGNVAAVFSDIPERYANRRTFNGDESDLRFLDPKGVVVALKAKGKAKKDTSGFVIHS